MNQSNGFLTDILKDAADDREHPAQDYAQSYLAKFRSLESSFFEKVHPLVDVGLAMREVQVARDGKPHIFTIHGCRHIVDLIRSLDKLAEAISGVPAGRLSVLESYILLCAAHVHDAANVKQREGHPDRCGELMAEHKDLFVSPAAMQQIYEVASVHGGKDPQFGKDTLRRLDHNNTAEPRLPMLAAMLRLADELAENAERVPDLVAKTHEHSDTSKFAFAYARSFQRFELRQEDLFLVYGVYPIDAALRGEVDGESITFFDFLELKLDVIDREARYCSQYGRPGFYVGRVHVSIQTYERPSPSPVKNHVVFSWSLVGGYPATHEPICRRSPELKAKGYNTLADFLASSTSSSATQSTAASPAPSSSNSEPLGPIAAFFRALWQ